MEERTFDRSGQHASVIGLGTWQLGADWGDVDDKEALAVLEAAAESGVTFFDTADVYGDGRSEQTIASFLSGRPDLHVLVATKMGRRVDQIPENYVLDNFRAWNDRSRRNLGVDRIDLVQLHCPPTPVYSTDEVFDALDTLVEEERVAAYGVSVETCAEALTAIARPNVASVQIILNPFRMKPLREVLPAAREAGVGVIARVPLASGLLSGKYTKDTVFPENDHRTFNRHGEAFDQGETFSGVDWATGVEAAAEFAALAPRDTPRPSSRCAGSSGSPASPPSSRAPARPSRPAPTRPPPGCRSCPTPPSPRSPACTTGGSASRWRAAGSEGASGLQQKLTLLLLVAGGGAPSRAVKDRASASLARRTASGVPCTVTVTGSDRGRVCARPAPVPRPSPPNVAMRTVASVSEGRSCGGPNVPSSAPTTARASSASPPLSVTVSWVSDICPTFVRPGRVADRVTVPRAAKPAVGGGSLSGKPKGETRSKEAPCRTRSRAGAGAEGGTRPRRRERTGCGPSSSRRSAWPRWACRSCSASC